MIDIKELRIGNCVKCTISNDHGVYKILALPNWEKLVTDDFAHKTSTEPSVVIDRPHGFKQIVGLSCIKSIRLTPDVLTKLCGFTTADPDDRYGGYVSPTIIGETYGKMRVVLNSKGYFEHFHNYVSSVPLLTVHKLQNLYFVQYGTELEIKGNVLV